MYYSLLIEFRDGKLGNNINKKLQPYPLILTTKFWQIPFVNQ